MARKSAMSMAEWINVYAQAYKSENKYETFKKLAIEKSNTLADVSDENWKKRVASIKSYVKNNVKIVNGKKVMIYRSPKKEGVFLNKELTEVIPADAQPYALPDILPEHTSSIRDDILPLIQDL